MIRNRAGLKPSFFRPSASATIEIIEPLQADKDRTTKRPLISVENERNFIDASGEIMEHFGPISAGAPKTATMKALRLT